MALVVQRNAGQGIQFFDGDELIAEITVAMVGRPPGLPGTPAKLVIQAPDHIKIQRTGDKKSTKK